MSDDDEPLFVLAQGGPRGPTVCSPNIYFFASRSPGEEVDKTFFHQRNNQDTGVDKLVS